MSKKLRSLIYLSSIIAVLVVGGFLLDYQLLFSNLSIPQQQTPTSSIMPTPIKGTNSSQSTTTKKYLIVLGKGGLNNYILALSNGAYISKMLNRTLLIHPCVQNDHMGTKSFHYSSSRLILNSECHSKVDFRFLYRVYEDAPYEIATKSHSVWNSGELKMCTGARGVSNFKLEKLFRDCESMNEKEDVLILDDLLYLGRSKVFDFSELVYDLVRQSFTHQKISLEQSMVVHIRLGDFDRYCSSRKGCYLTLSDMETELVLMKKKWNASKLIILSNFQLPHNITSRNNWIHATDILRKYSSFTGNELMNDGNLQVALEMATGVLAKYFIGNVYSTLSGVIATLRERYHADYKNTTTSISAMMGFRNDTSYVNVLELLSSGDV